MSRAFLSMALRVDHAAKPRLYSEIYNSAEFARASYILDLVFAAGIATLGLVLNSPAVVIGAMLISPLMGPILAAGLAFAASDIFLGVKSLVSLIVSVFASIAFSAALVWLLPFQSPTSELLARTQPNLLDLGVAVFSGLAGSAVMARAFSGGGASALPGVAIAVALMPPLCTVGFGVGSGWNWPIISGALLLFLTNLVAIAASAFVVFYLLGMDAPDVRASISEDEMRHATGSKLYTLLHGTALGRVFGEVGQLRWRLLMIAITLGALFVPLRSSLLQLRDETTCRAAARETRRNLVTDDHLLSEQLEILPDRVIQRIVTTAAVDRNRISAAEVALAGRTGKLASIQVRQVANEEELIYLRERLRAPAPAAPPPPPAPPTFPSIAASVESLLSGPIQAVWPTDSAELLRAEAGFAKGEIVVHLTYTGPKPLDPPAQEVIRNTLRSALRTPELVTDFVWQKPPRVVRRAGPVR